MVIVAIGAGALWLKGGKINAGIYKSCRVKYSSDTCSCISNTIEKELGGNNFFVAINYIYNDNLVDKAYETAGNKCANKAIMDDVLNIFK